MSKPEYRWKAEEAGGGADRVADAADEGAGGKEAVGADEGEDLVDRCEECDGVDGSEESEDEEAGEPEGGAGAHAGLCVCEGRPNFPTGRARMRWPQALWIALTIAAAAGPWAASPAP